MPKRWRILYFSNSETWRWALLADDVPVYESPEAYASEAKCKTEVEKVKDAPVRKGRKPTA